MTSPMIQQVTDKVHAMASTGVDPFVRETYRIFLLVLAGIAGIGILSYGMLPAGAFMPLAAADGLIWILCGWFGWRKPIALTLGLFTVITGLMMGPLAHVYGRIFLLSTAITAVSFGALTAYVHFSRKDFSFLRGFLIVSFWVLLVNFFFGWLIQVPFFHLLIAGLGVLSFLAWILFDTSRILERGDSEMTPALAAFELFLDIIGLHRWLMELLDQFGVSKD